MRSVVCSVLVLSAVVLCMLASSTVAIGDVTIKGRVEFYDRLRNQTKPAKNVLVRVRGDWWFTGDPETHTDENGYFTATQRNPILDGDTFTIHINAYAQTQGKISIYEWMLAWNAYNVDSPQVSGVRKNSTCTVNLVIGGPRGNVTETYCRTIGENANAFLVHQEILEHYKKLERMGFPANVFKDTDVIAPAMGQGSYYNYISDFINLTETSLLGKEGWNWGTANWSNIITRDSSYLPYKYVLDMFRHESSHRIHNRLTPFILVGLNIPAVHNPNMETNQYLALTEGFASFLPLATLGLPGVFEETCSLEDGKPLPIRPNEPASGIYNNCEGHVTALLLDLYDPANVKERMYRVARKAVTGETVPEAIVAEQKWTDRLADPNLVRIRSLLGKTPAWSSAVQTIADFLNAYFLNYPQDAHALKTIASNRAISIPLLPQRPAYIDGQIGIGRADNKTVWIKLNLVEFDKEDRPFVTLDCWRQNGSSVSRVGQQINLGPNWRDVKHISMQSLNLTPSQGPSDRLWLILSDEMQALAYCVPVPAAIEEEKSEESGSEGGHRDPWDRLYIEVPIPKIPTGDPADRIAPARDRMVRSDLSAALQNMASAEQQAKVTEFQTAIRTARAEMQAYAEAQDMAARMDRALASLVKSAGGVNLSAQTTRNAAGLSIRGANFGMTSITSDRAFQQWIGQVAAGQGLQQALPTETKSAMSTHLTLLNNAIQQRNTAAGRAQAAGQRLSAAYSALSFANESANVQKDIAKNMEDNLSALSAISKDTSLAGVLQQQASAIQAISAR